MGCYPLFTAIGGGKKKEDRRGRRRCSRGGGGKGKKYGDAFLSQKNLKKLTSILQKRGERKRGTKRSDNQLISESSAKQRGKKRGGGRVLEGKEAK